MVKLIIRNKGEASKKEQQEFIDLVLSANEVPENTLLRNVPNAESLIFLRNENILVGVAALKIPQHSYRHTISQKAGFYPDAKSFPFELGYIVISENERRRGHCKGLVTNALGVSLGKGVFATTRIDNVPMHRTLEKVGFKKEGKIFFARNKKDKIQLFLYSGGS